MNWISTFIFLLLATFVNILLGDFVLTFVNFKKNWSRRFIAGYFSVFLLGFLVGCPLTFMHVSWNVYFAVQSVVFGAVTVGVLFHYRKVVFCKQTYKQLFTKGKVISFVKENWFLGVIVAVLMFFSISNNMPIYKDGYDDVMYIGKMVNLIGAPAIGVEDPYHGSVVAGGIGGYKLFNTFELVYSYFSVLFHIQIIFFCRITMNLLNYILFVVIYKECAALFVKRSYAQYALILFIALAISAGYLTKHFGLYSYDLWRFQTAMFYGGTIAKNNTIPCLLIFGHELWKKIDWKRILVFIGFSISMISLSSIYVIEAGFVIVSAAIVYCIYQAVKAWKAHDHKKVLMALLGLSIIACVLLLTKKIDNYPSITKWSQFDKDYLNLEIPFYNKGTYLFRFGYLIFACFIIFAKDMKQKMLACVSMLSYLFVRFMYFFEFALLLGGYKHFAVCRYMASIQYILVLVCGIFLVWICSNIKKAGIILGGICAVFTGTVLGYVNTHLSDIVAIHDRADGVCELGYDFSRPFDFNTAMTPDITFKFGDYFNSLPYGNYRFFAGYTFPYQGKQVLPDILYISSNRIENCFVYGMYNGMVEEQGQILHAFCYGQYEDFEHVLQLLKDCDIDYYMVYAESSKQKLEDYGYSVVLGNEPGEEPYYLFKLQ